MFVQGVYRNLRQTHFQMPRFVFGGPETNAPLVSFKMRRMSIDRPAKSTSSQCRPKSSPWRANIATLKNAGLEFEMVWDAADDDFGAIRQAFLTNGSVEFAVRDGAVATAGSEGLRATMAITNFSRAEPLEEAIKVSVAAKPTYADHPPEWMTTTSSERNLL